MLICVNYYYDMEDKLHKVYTGMFNPSGVSSLVEQIEKMMETKLEDDMKFPDGCTLVGVLSIDGENADMVPFNVDISYKQVMAEPPFERVRFILKKIKS